MTLMGRGKSVLRLSLLSTSAKTLIEWLYVPLNIYTLTLSMFGFVISSIDRLLDN